MGWLDILVGRKAAKQARTVAKVAKSVRPKPATPEKAASASRIEWTKSEKGNDTAEVHGHRITIFKRDGFWNYCVAEILDEDDLAEGMTDETEFGDGYPTKAAAKKEALALIS